MTTDNSLLVQWHKAELAYWISRKEELQVAFERATQNLVLDITHSLVERWTRLTTDADISSTSETCPEKQRLFRKLAVFIHPDKMISQGLGTSIECQQLWVFAQSLTVTDMEQILSKHDPLEAIRLLFANRTGMEEAPETYQLYQLKQTWWYMFGNYPDLVKTLFIEPELLQHKIQQRNNRLRTVNQALQAHNARLSVEIEQLEKMINIRTEANVPSNGNHNHST